MSSRRTLVGSVLHPTDFSEASHRAFAHALAIALLRQTELTILHVGAEAPDDVDWGSFPPVRKTLERWNMLEPGSARSAVFDELKVTVRKVAVQGGSPIRATLKFIAEHPHELIVLATEGSDSGRDWLHHSDAEGIARGSGAMSLFVPDRASRSLVTLSGELKLSNILVPVDGVIDITGAVEFARRLADILGDGVVKITLLHAGERMPAVPPLAEGEGWEWRTSVTQGEPVDAILTAMQALSADLIVMATNGRDTLRQALMGSTTERVIRRSDCPVLAVPE